MEFIFPLRQHIGAPGTPLVRAGEKVRRGQRIASCPAGALGANLFSSVDGTVLSVDADRIVLEEKGTDFTSWLPLAGATPAERIEEAGIVGLGGAGFPTAFKLKTAPGAGTEEPSGVIIVNAAECEPILGHNIARIETEPELLLRGLAIVMDVAHAARGIIAIKAVHRRAVQALRGAMADARADIRIHELENLYPMGEERAIVRETLGVLLEPDQLPSAAGATVVNAETVLRIREAVEEKKPLIDKDMTVAGKLADNGSIHILRDVPVGMKVRDVLNLAGGVGPHYGELIMGGPFTGKRTTMDAPVLKTTGGIIAAEEFLPAPDPLGLLVCACGADEARLKQQAESMGARVCGVEFCKQARPVKNARKCENPGRCPGQVQKILNLKKAGAKAVLISNCTDCSNTVMSCAPKLGLAVYHCTDGALRAVNKRLIRRFHEDRQETDA